jgi:FMN hydrolase / 5-amino-6-(5-phospho-D-ribitylamino)uracil phosphatase
MRRMISGALHAICFDLDNTLWDVEPVLMRAERILADWLRSRYPRMAEMLSAGVMQEFREALLRELPQQAHDLSYLRRETLARMAAAAGYDRDIAHHAFAAWHAARNQCVPYDDVVPALQRLAKRFRLATLSNGNADLHCIGLAHHFEVSLHAATLGCAKPDPRTYKALADALTLKPEEILFVGDEPQADVLGPSAAGMKTAWLNRVAEEWPAALPPPDVSVSSLDELVTLLTH